MNNKKTNGIYMLSNLNNNKNYVGQTHDLDGREDNYVNDLRPSSNRYNQHLKNSFAKHGPDNFSFNILDADCDDQFDLNTTERYYIWLYDSYKPECGYNKTLGGNAGEATDETRKKISERVNEYWKDPNSRLKASELHKNSYKNPERKINLSEAQKKRFEDPNVRLKQSNGQKKRYEDPNERLKSSEAQKKRFEDPNERVKCGLKGSNHPRSKLDDGIVFYIKREFLTPYKGQLNYLYEFVRSLGYNVKISTLKNIKYGTNWKHINTEVVLW
jgi:group I intron endonuclease